jgi:hypothetical protein
LVEEFQFGDSDSVLLDYETEGILPGISGTLTAKEGDMALRVRPIVVDGILVGDIVLEIAVLHLSNGQIVEVANESLDQVFQDDQEMTLGDGNSYSYDRQAISLSRKIDASFGYESPISFFVPSELIHLNSAIYSQVELRIIYRTSNAQGGSVLKISIPPVG